VSGTGTGSVGLPSRTQLAVTAAVSIAALVLLGYGIYRLAESEVGEGR
jgi:hypothetical protein